MSDKACSKCGRPIVAKPGGCGTGYGRDREGAIVCYACCAIEDLDAMRAGEKATLYLVWKDGGYHVTNWPGTLDFGPVRVDRGRHNIAGARRDTWIVLDGTYWHGVQYGQWSDVCHCKRTKDTTTSRVPHTMTAECVEMLAQAREAQAAYRRRLSLLEVAECIEADAMLGDDMPDDSVAGHLLLPSAAAGMSSTQEARC